MRIRILTLLAGSLFLSLSLFGQKPKSNKEVQAINAINAATTLDDRIKAIENVLTNFADTEFKPLLLLMAMQLEEQKGDYSQTLFYAQRVLDGDPKNADALSTMAVETANHTREFDLDKEEKLSKVDKWAKDAIENAKTLPKSNPNMTDDQLQAIRKDIQAQAYMALGISAGLRKKYDDSIANYKQSIDVAAKQDPATYIRLGQVYLDAGKFDDANSAFDQAMNNPTATPAVKQIAQSRKAEVAKMKAAGPGAAAKPAQ